MSNKFIYQHRAITLQIGQTLPIYTDCKFFRVLENDGADFSVQLNEEVPSIIKRGMSIKLGAGNDLTKLTLINGTGAVLNIEITLSNDEVTDDRLNVSGSLDVSLAANTCQSPAAFAVTDAAQIAVAADIAAKEVVLQNNGANIIWLGDVNVDPANNRGYALDPATAVIWACNGNIYGRCAAGLASTLSIVRLREV